ncbi:MAG: nitrile hydratase accessory protein [Rubrivivax sp.]|nr:nitrile hydratase accessory protein [Rubrivivax sp.]
MKGDSPLLSTPLPISAGTEIKFTEPWEAKAFAIIVKLAEAGLFTWSEWVACFSVEVAAATHIETCGGMPPSYYEQWLVAAEKLMVAKGVTSFDQLAAKQFAIGSVGPAHQLK